MVGGGLVCSVVCVRIHAPVANCIYSYSIFCFDGSYVVPARKHVFGNVSYDTCNDILVSVTSETVRYVVNIFACFQANVFQFL